MSSSNTQESTATVQTPFLPTLYFENDSSDITQQKRQQEVETGASLNNLPVELLHRCLTQYSDWGDLAKLACVQSSWKNLVKDAAECGGRDAMWELSMCLLGDVDDETNAENSAVENEAEEVGSTEHSDENTAENENKEQVAIITENTNSKKNNRGLEKNEALAVKYLVRLSGVEVDESHFPTEISSEKNECAVFPHELKKVLSLNNLKINDTDADESALLKLATCHLKGTGISHPNACLALHYLQCAYHLTHSVESAHTLALIYEYPQQYSNNLVPIDVYAAFEWFKAAAEGGHVPSMAELALCYELGCGVSQSDDLALDWYTKAAQAGHGSAHYSVGEAYEEARGVPMDEEEACLWYYRAAMLGEEDGRNALRRLEHVARRVVPISEVDGLLGA